MCPSKRGQITPTVFQQTIKLHVKQEFSNFQRTQVSNIQSPTLNKRSIDTTITLKDGDIVIIGGLVEQESNGTDQSIFKVNVTESRDTKQADTILILQVKKI